MRFGAKEEKFNNMQSMLGKLIGGLSNATDQQQTTALATNLFNSGVLKIGTGNVISFLLTFCVFRGKCLHSRFSLLFYANNNDLHLHNIFWSYTKIL